MSENPYQAPQVIATSNDGDADPTLDRSASMLRQTKPWVRFVSVMVFIGAAFMVLGGLFMVGSVVTGISPGFSAGVGIVYIAMALIYVIPAVFLWKYADRIALFLQERSTGTLASALEAQKSFWKFVGILMLVIMAIYALIIVFAIFAAVVSSMG